MRLRRARDWAINSHIYVVQATMFVTVMEFGKVSSTTTTVKSALKLPVSMGLLLFNPSRTANILQSAISEPGHSSPIRTHSRLYSWRETFEKAAKQVNTKAHSLKILAGLNFSFNPTATHPVHNEPLHTEGTEQILLVGNVGRKHIAHTSTVINPKSPRRADFWVNFCHSLV